MSKIHSSTRLAAVMRVVAFALALGLAGPVHAQFLVAVPKGLVDISGGGDVGARAPFLTLSGGETNSWQTVYGVCRTLKKALLFSDFWKNQVLIRIAGEADTFLFATGLNQPTSIACSDAHVYVAEFGNGEITDITYPEKVSNANFGATKAFAWNVDKLDSVVMVSGEKLFALTSTGKIFDVTAGGDFAAAKPFITSTNVTSFGGLVETTPGTFWIAQGGKIYEMKAGGELTSAPVVASVSGTIVGLTYVEGLGTFAAMSGSKVVEVSKGGDLTAAKPYATNVPIDLVSPMLYWHKCGDGVVMKSGGETCDDGNEVDTDACNNACQLPGGSTAPKPDAGVAQTPGADAGTPARDAGVAPADGAVTAPDAGGTSVADAGTTDASTLPLTAPDAATTATKPELAADDSADNGGCSVRTGGAGPGAWAWSVMGLLALVVLRRSRPREN